MQLNDEIIRTILTALRDFGKRLELIEGKLLPDETIDENSTENTPVFHNIETNTDPIEFKKTHMKKVLDDATDLAILHYKKVPPKRRFNK